MQLTRKLFFICLSFLVIGCGVFSERLCPFCEQRVIDKQLVHEMDKMVILYCLTPAAEGNVLVIPKRHVENFAELNLGELEELMIAMQRMKGAFEEVYGVTDYIVLQKNGVLAGQSQPHTHFHMIPCAVHLGKIVERAVKYRAPLTDEEMAAAVAKLRPYFLKYE